MEQRNARPTTREKLPKHLEHAVNNVEKERKKKINRARAEEEEGTQEEGALAVAKEGALTVTEEEEARCTKVFKKRTRVF